MMDKAYIKIVFKTLEFIVLFVLFGIIDPKTSLVYWSGVPFQHIP